MDEAAPRVARFRVGDKVRSRVSFADVRVGMLGIARAIVVTSMIIYVLRGA